MVIRASPHETRGHGPRSSLPLRPVLAVVVLVPGFFLLAEHRAHLLGVLPWLLLLACPLLHLLMHGGHGGHGKADDGTEAKP